MNLALNQDLKPRKQIPVRCPCCLKLYSVNEDQIIETRPEFQCKNCSSFFYFEYPKWVASETKEILGLPLYRYTFDQNQNLRKLKARNLKKKIKKLPQHFCPDCSAPYYWGDKDCFACGRLLNKKRNYERKTPVYSVRSDIKQMWKNLLKDYENDAIHEQFLRTCQTEDHLGYATARYQSMIDVNPHDQRAQKSIKRLQALASLPFIKQNLNEKYEKKAHLPWVHFLLILSFGFIVTGFLIPLFVNLIGLGIALAFLSLALRFYFQKVF